MQTIEAEAPPDLAAPGSRSAPRGGAIVIKIGGAAMDAPETIAALASEAAALRAGGARVVVVHGGGAAVSAMGRRLGLAPRFIDGLRVTDEETMRVAQLVQIGGVSRDLIAAIGRAGGRALGLSGHDLGGWLRARRRVHRDRRTGAPVDLGRVGDVTAVDAAPLLALCEAGWIPVVAPVAVDDALAPLNVNADSVAAAVAGALTGSRLLLLSDVAGVRGPDGAICADVDGPALRRWIADGVIQGGMIPKIEACLAALDAGAVGASIADGRPPGAIAAALAGGGTLARASA